MQATASPHTLYSYSVQFIITVFLCVSLSGIRPGSALCQFDKGLIHSCCFGKGRGMHANLLQQHMARTQWPQFSVSEWGRAAGKWTKPVHPPTPASHCRWSLVCVCLCRIRQSLKWLDWSRSSLNRWHSKEQLCREHRRFAAGHSIIQLVYVFKGNVMHINIKYFSPLIYSCQTCCCC